LGRAFEGATLALTVARGITSPYVPVSVEGTQKVLADAIHARRDDGLGNPWDYKNLTDLNPNPGFQTGDPVDLARSHAAPPVRVRRR